jgi:MSHA biogenesis protein MshJ
MKRLWQRYAGFYDALSLRERTMIFAAAAVVVVAFGYLVLLDGENARQRRLSAAIAQKRGEMKALEAQVGQLVEAKAADPDRAVRERLAIVRSQLADTETAIGAEERKFTAPGQMRSVVEGLLGRRSAVRLVELKTLPVTSIADARAAASGTKPAATPGAGKPAAADRLIYRHGIEVTVSGAYLDLLGYARELETLPTQLYWGGLEIDAAAYPRVVMKLTVYTLSLDRAWLNV